MMPSKLIQFVALTGLVLAGCGKSATTADVTSTTEDSSVSGTAASSVGGALASSSSSGTVAFYQAPNSMNKSAALWSLFFNLSTASNACPTLTTANGSGCSNVTSAVDLTYSSCNHGNSPATWTGIMEVSLSSSSPSCGTFPHPTSGDIKRQFVSSANVPGTGSRTTARGTVEVIDHQTADLGNFDNQTIAANIGSGYGTVVTFTSGARTGVSIRQRTYVTGGRDHSVKGDITIAESGTTRTTNGTTTVYHNKAKVIGTSTFTNVTYNDTSCVPVSGSIATAFTAGANVAPNAIGNALVGKTETMTFNSDSTATLVDASGASSTVALTHCY